MLKSWGHIKDQLYEVELAKAEIEHKKPIIVVFFILEYNKLSILELYYNFSKKITILTCLSGWNCLPIHYI